MPAPQEVIRRKRDRQVLTEAEIRSFVEGITDGSISEAQIGAFTMSIYLNGMTTPERVALALAMRDSGEVLDWSKSGVEPRTIIDKHSSGGVGDEKVTLLVVPLAAACGLTVPNLSGWGLDYCGGEMDMLASVPGYDGAPSPDKYMKAVLKAGGAISAPTLQLAPADRKIFKVRDVTATVESVALITGSIMSKKLAVNPSGVVICVGSGTGAYMPTVAHARELAESMSTVATGAGIPSVMLLTDLDAVLGTSVGSAVEMVETVDFLTGKHQDPRTRELVIEVTADMLRIGDIAADMDAARKLAAAKLADGSAARHFATMIEALGGPADFVERPEHHLPKANVIAPVYAEAEGYVSAMNAKEVGLALIALGGGRTRPDDPIDLTVGFTDFCQVGDKAGSTKALCTIHARDQAEWDEAARRIRAAITLSATTPKPLGPIVIERIERHP
ncbi:MAG: thymidine phosphorylase [Rhizobiales bacterium]|nr:thymidine phosphorylase [Hyphomicrobiales bacterium]